MPVHDLVRTVVGDYLDLIDGAAPGLVEGLYLVGSAVLGDFRLHASDIDFVAVTADRPDAGAVAALDQAHRRWHGRRPRPSLDGMFVTWRDLAGDPACAGPGAVVHDGEFQVRGGGCDPVTWHTLARYGQACRGPDPAELTVWADADGLARWTDDNLDRYWRGLLDRASRLHRPWGLAALSAYTAVWVVTGVSRLHYTLATGDITTKEGAARYAREAFSERWHRVIDESLRIRRADRAGPTLTEAVAGVGEFLPGTRVGSRRSPYRTPFARRRDVLEFGELVIVDAHQL